LLENNININQKDYSGLCCLDYINYNQKSNSSLNIPEMLFSKGANVNYVDSKGKLPIENALDANNNSLVLLLLNKNCSIKLGKNSFYMNKLLELKKSLNLCVSNDSKYSHLKLRKEKRNNKYKIMLSYNKHNKQST
jgi:ankyrin repeat protein